MTRLLHIFPASGFDRSAATPVLLGVLLSWVLTETFGWVFAGLVVPGYLAALFVLDPRVATVDVGEAVVTYVLSRLLGEHLARTGLTSRMFGRERFFLIVLVSIVVRLAVEGVAFPRLVSHATWAFSIGLVVVPLTANACWKTGLSRGALQTGVPAALVYVLLRFVLLPHTNLSLAGFGLATENISASFLASPKTYILLLTGALLAAFANLRYGWDYSGILIPALLTLVAIHPLKLAATIVEVVVLLGAVPLVVRLTPLRRANIEGPRRLVLFFTVDYGLRFAFAAIVGRSLPAADVVDLMGFGYLLPTLLAVKVSQKGLASLVLLPAVTVAMVAFGVGTLIGFAAVLVDDGPAVARRPVTRDVPRAPSQPSLAALWVSALARPTPAKGELERSGSASRLARAVDELLAHPDAAAPPDLEAQRLDDDVLLVRERFEALEDRLGEPSILATARTSGASGRNVVVVPAPLRCPECAALAGRLLETRAIDAVVVAGVDEGEEGTSTRTAGSVARSLAGSRNGLIASFRRGDADVARARIAARAVADARTQPLLRALREQVFELREDAIATTDGPDEIALELPAARAYRWLPEPLVAEPLTSATEIADVLASARRSTTPVSLEDRLALRRLVLEPLLDASLTSRAVPSAVTRAAASMLGYVLRGPSKLAEGSDAILLLPGSSPRPIAVLARTGGVRGVVIEVPRGSHAGLRALGVDLAGTLHADVLLVGLEADGRLFGNETLRDAHAAATWPQPERETRVVVLRTAALEAAEHDATVGALPVLGSESLLATVEAALRDAGVHATRAPLDLAAREEAGRSFFGDTRLVEITAGQKALQSATLESARESMRELGSLPRFDASCAEVVRRLEAELPADGPTAPVALLDLARLAAVERSIVARRALEEAVATSASRAALARTERAVYLIVVARTGRRTMLIAAIPVLAGSVERPTPLVVPTVEACLPLLVAGGQCRVESR